MAAVFPVDSYEESAMDGTRHYFAGREFVVQDLPKAQLEIEYAFELDVVAFEAVQSVAQIFDLYRVHGTFLIAG